ncbi:riboflavin biosynthesis protein RibD [Methyloprofundus sedimenti]|uniref:Riboflavin biosynthesis protein RibD n=1 Tax=Methyloprofundus sedimenti TaxID=1420851 RepID=A0A1V8M9Z9_9GAMM|nr:dihydrofolate reductase family protein [Methyloprofundus sedimenti]OQK18420.1 riboflavin biosynthesis protein RibD [Methyloprofundus sedimenti]
MSEQLLNLYPLCGQQQNLKDLYLAHRVDRLGSMTSPFVYANFLSSLDGRIALEDKEQNLIAYIPKHITTVSDFKLFMELHAQADCLITHGGYMRALNENRLGNVLQVKSKELIEWRCNNGLKPQPTVIIASASMEFPMHPSLHEHQQDCFIATGKNADVERIRYWQDHGYKVLISGEEQMVQGAALIQQLKKLDYKSIYLIAGPRMLDTMIREKQLSRLYLTITHQLIGGLDFRTLLTGPPLENKVNMKLKSLYYEPDSPPGSGQFFMHLDL